MLAFDFRLTNRDGNIIRSSIEDYGQDVPDILELNGDFVITIDSKTFFSEPEFPIIEFLIHVDKWMQNDAASDMDYHSLETEDNPLIRFVLDRDGWIITSPWQLHRSSRRFSREEITEAIEALKKKVQIQLLEAR